jgi:spore germination protein KA
MGYVAASCVRMLRYLALTAALLLPGLYLSMAAFHQEMLPMQLLRSIIESKHDVPFSTATEVLALLLAFELLQEAGLHLPRSIGQSVSIIGGLVVGTAAVEAKLISPAALIIVSVAGICGFVLPERDFADAVRVWRFVLALCASLTGLFGLTAGTLLLLIQLAELRSCGVPYLEPFSAGRTAGQLIRRRLKERP